MEDNFGGMIMKTNGASVRSSGFFGLLFITFLVLKLTHVIDWSWWWVTAPLWGGFLFTLLVGAIAILIVALRKDEW